MKKKKDFFFLEIIIRNRIYFALIHTKLYRKNEINTYQKVFEQFSILPGLILEVERLNIYIYIYIANKHKYMALLQRH